MLPCASQRASRSYRGACRLHALRDIEPGEYVCNAKILDALAVRDVGFALPASPNFSDDSLDPITSTNAPSPADSPAPHEERPMFQGYYRGDARGTGTRNHLVLLGVNSRAASFVKAMEERLVGLVDEYPNVDGLVAVAHTGGRARPPEQS
ncbi:MAG: UxaA family hydrolase [Chloroflexia bacterium]